MSTKKSTCKACTLSQPSWSLTITKGDNGYVLSHKESDGATKIFVIQEADWEENCELEAMKEVLWNVAEYFGIFNSKHKLINLNVTLDKNSDLEE